MGTNWTDEKEDFLRENYPEWSDEEFAKKFGTTASAVERHRSKIGVTSRWTQKEDQFIKDNYRDLSDKELADELNRSKSAIRNRRSKKLDLKRPNSHCGKFNHGIHWSEEKENFLKLNYDSMKYQEIAEKFGTSYQAVLNKACELNLVKQNVWKQKEIDFVRENYKQMGDKELAKKLDMNKIGIRNLRHSFDIVRPSEHISKFRDGNHWSEDDKEFLREKFDSMKYQEMADELGVTYHAVESKAHKLGLEKIEQWSKNEVEFLRNNWKTLSDHEIAEKLDRSLTAVMQKRSKKLNLVREDPTANEYKWREWENYCEKVANQIWDNVLTQHTFEQGYRADIYLPEKNKVVEVKWSYYQDWNADKYLGCDGVDEVVVWCYHEVPPNSCNLPLLVRHDLFNMIEDEKLIEEIEQIKDASSYQANLETALQA